METLVKIHSIETMGALDGPGIRTVIFFQGCPMRCIYCHNADTFNVSGGQEKTVNELLDFCKRYKNFYGDNGGVTLSGGEPLLQSKATIELLKQLKENDINTALDTAGSLFCSEALDLADLTILDIKHSNAQSFSKITKYDSTNTFKTLKYLQENKKRFWVRQVIVMGLTDSIEQVRSLKALAFGAEKIELLPYHSMGADKWKKAGLKYELENSIPPSNELMQKLNAVLTENN